MKRMQEWFDKAFKSLKDAGMTFAIFGIVAAAIGNFLSLGFLVSVGLAGFGAGVVAWGVDSLQGGEMMPLRGLHVRARLEGFFASVWGLLFVLGGFLLIGYGVLSIMNPRSPIPPSLRQYFQGTQGGGVLWLIGGLIGVLFALTMIFAADTPGSSGFVRFVKSLPGRLVGILLLAVFALLSLGALVQIFAPEMWGPILEFVQEQLYQVLL